MSRLTKFFRLSATDRWLVMEAVILLGLARLAVITLPFRWVATTLGQQSANPDNAETSKVSEQQAGSIAWTVRRIGRYTPWNSNCLAKAIAGRLMLRRRRIVSTLYFGMTKNTEGQLEAHAWLKCGESILTGGSNLERYAIVAKFTD